MKILRKNSRTNSPNLQTEQIFVTQSNLTIKASKHSTLCLKKTRNFIFYHNYGKCQPIFVFFQWYRAFFIKSCTHALLSQKLESEKMSKIRPLQSKLYQNQASCIFLRHSVEMSSNETVHQQDNKTHHVYMLQHPIYIYIYIYNNKYVRIISNCTENGIYTTVSCISDALDFFLYST